MIYVMYAALAVAAAMIAFMIWMHVSIKNSLNAPPIKLMRGDAYEVEISGESHYQKALSTIAGPRKASGVEIECTALLIPEPNNQKDRKAIRVDINDMTVGYIPKDDTHLYHGVLNFHRAEVAAVIVGGWSRSGRGAGHYGVKLSLAYPFKAENITA